ncbi:Calcium/calmodulin-dependent 3'5'-cyclic nucleotide phosphodiesterase 1C [Taenia solium]|eukprot:TsM_000588500 transcript=TsM_000588500 gene=TsM_000588500
MCRFDWPECRQSFCRRLRDEDDELSETACSEVPDEVRDWLATTFTRNPSGSGRVAKPRFRSVVNAIRAGIVVERIYRRMSSCTCLTLPPNVILLLKSGLDEWNFDVFEFNEVSCNHALKYVGFELLHKYNLISKFQASEKRL